MYLDDDETMRSLTPDVKRLEFFKFNGEEPELEYWFEDTLNMFFSWGDNGRLSYW